MLPVASRGFFYVFNNQYKNSIVHPAEVKELWNEAFRSLLANHSSIDKIYSENLLGDAAMSYAFSNDPLTTVTVQGRVVSAEALQTIKMEYSIWRQNYKKAAAGHTIELNALGAQKSHILHGVNARREQWLQPARRMHRLSLQEADSLYKNSLRPFITEKEHAIRVARQKYSYSIRDPHDQTEVAHKGQLDRLLSDAIARINREFSEHPDIRDIELSYQRDKVMCNFLLEHSEKVVNGFFDNQVRQLNREVDFARSDIDHQYSMIKEKVLSPQLDGIFNKQRERIQNPLNEGVPSFQRRWVISSFTDEPSWNMVYGERPYFDTQFSSNISRNAWDLFWGREGMGYFASRPVNAWNDIFTDHSAFPLRNQWFNLHSSRQQPHVGMFVQGGEVPQYQRSANDGPRVVPGSRTQTAEASTKRR